jgi:hypothetical protein
MQGRTLPRPAVPPGGAPVNLLSTPLGGGATTMFFTYQFLATFAGASAATTLVVAAIAGLPGVRSLSSRLVTYLVAVVLLGLGLVFTGQAQWMDVPLLFLNALLVATSSIGVTQITSEAVASMRRSSTKTT